MPGSHSLSASALDFCFFAHLLFASLQAPLDSGVGRSSSRFPWTSSLNLQRNLSDVKSSPRVSSRVNWFLSRAKPSTIQSLKINMFFNWFKCLEGAEEASSLDFERRRHSPWALILPYWTWSELDSEVSLNFFWVRAWPWFEAVILLSLTGSVEGRREVESGEQLYWWLVLSSQGIHSLQREYIHRASGITNYFGTFLPLILLYYRLLSKFDELLYHFDQHKLIPMIRAIMITFPDSQSRP